MYTFLKLVSHRLFFQAWFIGKISRRSKNFVDITILLYTQLLLTWEGNGTWIFVHCFLTYMAAGTEHFHCILLVIDHFNMLYLPYFKMIIVECGTCLDNCTPTFISNCTENALCMFKWCVPHSCVNCYPHRMDVHHWCLLRLKDMLKLLRCCSKQVLKSTKRYQ